MSSDKKVSARAFTEGRGTRAVAECFLPRAVVERYLKVTPEQLVADHEAALSGSIQNGSIGHNINVSNVVAAAFVATGQDVACVHESSLAQLAVQLVDDGVYASMLLPSLVVGTVGGGTHLPRQNELLGMMGCAGSGKVKRLAEILAGYCLALDLSTGAAVSGGQFVAAHEQLGRNRPVRAFGAADLTPAFFEPGVRRFLEDETIEMLDVETIDRHDSGGSILTALASIGTEKTIGLYPRRLSFRAKGRRTTIARDVMVKIKARDEDVTRLGLTCATMCGTALATAYAQSAKHLDHIGSHRRELALYENETDPRFRRHTPRIYGIHRDDARHGHVVVMELLPESALADRAGHSRWAREEILAAIDGIAAIHAISYGRSEELHAREWLGPARTVAQMNATLPLWQSLLDFAVTEHPEWFDARAEAEHRALLDMLPDWWRSLDALPKALVHNDFNPRNIALRGSPEGPRLCAFDWELAAILPPQHDLAELLANVLTPDVGRAELNTFIERHRLALEQESGVSINKDEWYRGVHLCTADLLVNRLGLYVMAHSARTLPFLERAIFTARHILRLTRPGAIDGVAA